MKSYINTLADYRKAPFEKNVTITCPPEHMQAQMKHLTRPYKKTQAIQTIQKGDVVILSLESELPRFNRPMIPITIGGKLFDEELENAMIDHTVGESFVLNIHDTIVKVSIKQATRTIFPQPTDEMVIAYAQQHEEFSGLKTVDEYRQNMIQKYFDEQYQQTVFNTMDEVSNYVLTHSDWYFDEGEVQEELEMIKEEIREQLKEDHKTLEDLSQEELDMNFGISSLEELDQVLIDSVERNIANTLWLMNIHKTDSIDNIDGYPYDFLQDFVEDNLNITKEN